MPTLFGAATLPAVPVGPTPFTRKNWDNPIRYKLNRAYGDEFEYNSFTQLTRRWTVLQAAVAADFDFPGGSSINWIPPGTTTGNAIGIAAPAGDFEAVLEFSYAGYNGKSTDPASVFGPAIGLTNTAGTGACASFYPFDLKIYDAVLTAWATGTSNGTLAGGAGVIDGRHLWVAMRRTGTTLQGRVSADGSTFSALTVGSAVSATAQWLSIAKAYPGSTMVAGFHTLHRLNVYPGPTFFPG